MQKNNFSKAGIFALLLMIAFVAGWEGYLRHKGAQVSYNEDESLWSDKRKQVYEPIDKATVFIGSSRIKYDLDIDTWERETGDNAIQLAIEGNNPRPMLEDLANDTAFRGKLIVDVTEVLFFSNAPYVTVKPIQNIGYYKKETPAQQFSFTINHALESQFVFLNKEDYSLNALLAKTGVRDRPGVYALPEFPEEFHQVTFDRQTYMTDAFVKDTTLSNKVINIWAGLGKAIAAAPVTGGAADSIIASVKLACDKIQARGGKVIFIRTPSNGFFLAGENAAFPRAKFWNKLLAVTGCPGIHFTDYNSLAHFQCPELSHLSRPDAVLFTQSLIPILEEKGWAFPHAANHTITSSNL